MPEKQKTVNETAINWYPGHMAKSQRAMQETIKAVDIIIELRDARIPMASANPLLKQLGLQKPSLIVLNKKDLADPEMTKIWLSKIGKETPVIAVDALKDPLAQIIPQKVKELLKDKIAKAQQRGIRNKVMRAMIVGIPNVGKSTFINTLIKKSVAPTANRPGVTRKLHWIRLRDDLELLDTPGVLWPKFEDPATAKLLALLAAISDRVFDHETIVLFALDYLLKVYPQRLSDRYEVAIDKDPLTLVKDIAVFKKWLKAGGEIDYRKAYDMILHDIRNNQLKGITWEDPRC